MDPEVKVRRQPGLDATPVIFSLQIQERAESFERAGFEDRFRKREIAPVDEEVLKRGGLDAPAGRGDFDGLAQGIREVEDEIVGADGDAAGNGLRATAFRKSPGFENGESVIQGARTGYGFVYLQVAGEEPIAEAGGTKGPDLVGIVADGKTDAGLTVGGYEGRCEGGALQQALHLLIELADSGHGYSRLVYSRGERWRG